MEKKTKPGVGEPGFNGFDDDILDPNDFKDDEAEGGDGEGKDKKDPKKGDDDPNKKPGKGDGKEGDDEGADKKDPKKDPDKKDPKSDAELTDEEKKEKEKNAYYAEMRRKKEAQEKAKKIAEQEARDKQLKEQATIEGKLSVLKTNPYTEKPIRDAEDLEIYEIQRELEKAGKDPVNDLSEEIANRNRIKKKKAEDEAKAKKDADLKQQEDVRKEVDDFKKAHPDVDIAELSKDPEFIKVAEGKWGNWPLEAIYSKYLLDKKDSKAGDDKGDDEGDGTDKVAKKATKVPSPKPGSSSKEKSVLDMTEKEFKEREEKSKKEVGDFF